MARSEEALFRFRRQKLSEGQATLRRQMQIAQEQLAIVELSESYAQHAYREAANKKAELSVWNPVVQQRGDQLRRAEIRSPVRGRVNRIMVATHGGVIQAAEPIMDITPMDDRLLVEAKVRPRNVAFITKGTSAKVKITAYDYMVYGDLAETVEQISADTVEENTACGKETYYQVLIRTDGESLKKDEKLLPIIPGMVAEVDIINGKRSVLSYLLKPIVKAKLH